MGQDERDGQAAVDWVIREGFTWMPSVAEVLRAAVEFRRMRPIAALTETTVGRTEEEIRASEEAAARVLAAYRARHPQGHDGPKRLEEVVTKRIPPAVDPAEVEAKRARARQLKDSVTA